MVKSVVFPRIFINKAIKDLDPCPSILGVCPLFELYWIGFVVPH